jgi:antitoxin (DNA-binding transcriptional repressor) of toxin-antitoxin stability system
MNTISAKFLRANLQSIVRKVVEQGISYTVIYRSTPVFEINPIENKKVIDVDKWISKATGLGMAKDVSSPQKDKAILKKRLKTRHAKSVS